MFVRVKKIKGYKYAYLVENSWNKGTSKQKVKGYLGRVYDLPLEEKEFAGSLDGSFSDVVIELLKWQLECYGFGIAKEAAVKDGLKVVFDDLRFMQEKSGKSFVLKGKEGYLCPYTLKKLLDFKSEGYEEKVGRDLAHAFVEAGINIPKEVFIKVFEKVYVKPED